MTLCILSVGERPILLQDDLILIFGTHNDPDTSSSILRMEVGKGRMQHTATLIDEHLGSCHIQLLPMMLQ